MPGRSRIEEKLEKVINVLKFVGGKVSVIRYRGCRYYAFQIAYRNSKPRKAVIKVTSDIESVKKEDSYDLKALAVTIKATPLIVGEKFKNKPLLDYVVYSRYGLTAVSFETFVNAMLHNILPKFYADRGGYYARVKGEVLARKRREMRLSLGKVASLLGVSRKTVYEYERENLEASLEVAYKLVEVFGEDVIEDIDIFREPSPNKFRSEIERVRKVEEESVSEIVGEKVVEAYRLSRSPFNMVVQTEDKVYTVKVVEGSESVDEVVNACEVSSTLDADAKVIVKDVRKRSEVLDRIQAKGLRNVDVISA